MTVGMVVGLGVAVAVGVVIGGAASYDNQTNIHEDGRNFNVS